MAKSKKKFECGHKGFGKKCHRCDQALHLKDLSEAGAKYQTFKTQKPKTWTPQEMMAECDRLLEVPRRSSNG